MRIFKVILLVTVVFLAACSQFGMEQGLSEEAGKKLDRIIATRSDDLKVRDSSRNPRETIAFFGIEPGMRVAEVLPGRGWYTQILAPYVGKEGGVYGVNYADDMWPMFGFFDEETIAERIESMKRFDEKVAGFAGEPIPSQGFAFGRIPKEVKGTMDVVFVVRALHNLSRFEEKAGTLTNALNDINSLLKVGGVAGVVQHRAPETADDEWASGRAGYLKVSNVIAMFTKAGFELVGSSEINANPKDQPTTKDIVWRLPPSPRASEESLAVGESDRMTLLFRKK